MRESPIYILDSDAARLRGLLASRGADLDGRDHEHLSDLAAELERAFVVSADAVPRGVARLNSRVQIVDLQSGEQRELTLVFPSDADPVAGRVSVLAPLGCALVGCREGEIVEWQMPGGLRRLKIDKVASPGAPAASGRRKARLVRPAVCSVREERA